ncbi:MAG: tRNA pseudouridine(38-40) synthase TruA [Ignavibacteriaceae bacterium]
MLDFYTMFNYKLILQYDGTNYAGWQIQHNCVTVQEKITNALKVLLKEEVNLIGSGRTDSGVHAYGQAANFRTGNKIDIYKFKHSLNSMLPPDISVIDMKEVVNSFHARYDAKKRSYLYFISKYKSPFYARYSYFYHNQIDIPRLNQLSRYIIKEENFTSFARKNSGPEDKTCIIYNAQWTEKKGMVIFLIEANRFLHGMVRSITGTLLNAVKNNFDEKYIQEIISAGDRETAGESVPAKGLFLYKVRY